MATILKTRGYILNGRATSLDDMMVGIREKLPDVLIVDACFVRRAALCQQTMQQLRQIPRVIVCMETGRQDYHFVLDENFDAYLCDADPNSELFDCLRPAGWDGIYYGRYVRELSERDIVINQIKNHHNAA